ncbi:hypothetical protein FisN_1Lh692 [Fistulifera solaris]|uniref:C2 domain-containing protein n=1 Tax=Fistulifera solaris TaxID=1519565 RepID=A0A1Z5K138_FISSO|nr:hypothetical protein FisN_1Lh692 [Fistulifera solaris]|eukprot:GAX19852.1 hypothetical protein FisN_1Lh692 [Fistulifera solaris]
MKLEISVHALKLKNVAGAFKGTSDPFAILTQVAATPGTQPNVLGKTEVIKNNLNPHWVKVFYIDYELGIPIKVAVNIFDEVTKGDNKGMGSAVFDIGECLGARGNVKAKKLRKGGTVFLSARKAQGSGLMRLQLKGANLKNVEGMFSKSDPFFELSKKVSNAGGLTWDNVHRSPVVKNNLNPAWETTIIELSTLCDGDFDMPIQVSVFDHESSGKHKAMGKFETTVNGFIQAAKNGSTFDLLQKGKAVGSISVVKAEVSGVAGVEDVAEQMKNTSIAPITAVSSSVLSSGSPNFVDYTAGGCAINVIVAIDFTGSNGDPRQPGTLHYLSSERNDYEKAIAAIVSVLAKYDSDQSFPVYGFGAKYAGEVRHCFQCGPQEEVKGVSGVLDAYHKVFASGLVMSGPTVFTEVIETAAAKAQSSLDMAQQRGSQTYTVLLILTDGAVSDAHATARCLDQASDAPLSVVIVGVGNADFSSMQFLDDAAGPGKRDIAQFVEFNKHKHNSASLTSETLKEVPTQLTKYFLSHGIAPLPPLQRTDSILQIDDDDDEEEIDLTLDIGEDEIVVSGGGSSFVDGFNASR